MSYQVLARKWRPAKFEQVVGQSHVLLALTNALTQKRLHHAYLFSGTRGVGKTSLARLFAKGLNCEQGVTATPCGQCSACIEIAEGRFVDLIEVDAASRTKVDDTRELLDNVQYRPSRGRFKVYLIDEVHMLSRSSFNALLKTLEEPPEHVKFLLATTDPQRLPVTVLSRCLQFNLKSLTQDEIAAQLSKVLTREGLNFEHQALSLIAKAANGSMRDAMSLADQAIAFGAGQIALAQVQTMLGTIDEKHVISLLDALVQADIMNLMQVTAKVLSFGADPEEVLRSLLELLHQITLTQFAPAAAQVSLYSEQICAFAGQLSPEQVQLYYQLLLTGRKDLPHAPDPKSGLEMALLRAVTFVPEEPVNRWTVDKPVSLSLPRESQGSKAAPDQNVEPQRDSTSPALAVKASEPASQPQTQAHRQANAERAEVEPEPLDDELTSLNTEMAVILSQAESQGIEPARPKDAPAPGQEPHVAACDDTAQYETYAGAQTAYQGEESQHFYGQDDYVAANNDHGERGHGNSTTGNRGHSPNPGDGNTQAADVDVSAKPASRVPDVDTEPGLGDDLLDAVLAARESLLEDLGEDDPKAETAKKPEAGRMPFVPPVRKQTPVAIAQDEVADSPGGSDTAELAQASGQKNPQTQQSQETRVEDRPPWETPHESDLSPRFPVAATDETVTAPGAAGMSSDGSTATPQEHLEAGHSEGLAPVMAQSGELVLPVIPSGEITGHTVDLQWYRFMSELDVGGRVRQLAVNSVCHKLEQPLSLLLKPDQKHLAADVAIKQLEESMSHALEQTCSVLISVGVDDSRETPLEVRRRFHKELLTQAHHGLMTDENIQWLSQNMGAELEQDTLSYAPELLSQKGNIIELVDMSNFNRLPGS